MLEFTFIVLRRFTTTDKGTDEGWGTMSQSACVVLMPTVRCCADVAYPLLNVELRGMSSFVKGK